MKNEGVVVKVSGPLVIASGMSGAKMYDLVRVGSMKLIGEIVELRGDTASIQVYEETSGIGPGAPVVTTGAPLCAELAPGLISSIFDGIQRPLDVIRMKVGDYIPRGLDIPGISRERKWHFKAVKEEGDTVDFGDIIGVVNETAAVTHRIMVPEGISGRIIKVSDGLFSVDDVVAEIDDGKSVHGVTMLQKWPVRKARPYREKLLPNSPLATGQRVIDTFFPISKGGTACVPGPFGSGKTIVQHQLAKWSDADIIVYIGCGERGNEMASVLLEFPELKDPRTGGPLIQRTVLIANTSNMPVAAREASIYTGITIAEYFRDMGYSVAVMADSTSRWAEALREMSGRLEEMPGEEGYPAYLPAKLADFYERAGRVRCMGSDSREGTLSIIGAVSPPGGDLSDPVVQATLKVVKVFWSLEDWLAYERHFPAINWLTSYSLYHENLSTYFKKEFGNRWSNARTKAIEILQREADLKEITRLVGIDSISAYDRILLETAKLIREDFLHQNAFDEADTYTSFEKQLAILSIILQFYDGAIYALDKGVLIGDILEMKTIRKISRLKFLPEGRLEVVKALSDEMEREFTELTKSDSSRNKDTT